MTKCNRCEEEAIAFLLGENVCQRCWDKDKLTSKHVRINKYADEWRKEIKVTNCKEKTA